METCRELECAVRSCCKRMTLHSLEKVPDCTHTLACSAAPAGSCRCYRSAQHTANRCEMLPSSSPEEVWHCHHPVQRLSQYGQQGMCGGPLSAAALHNGGQLARCRQGKQAAVLHQHSAAEDLRKPAVAKSTCITRALLMALRYKSDMTLLRSCSTEAPLKGRHDGSSRLMQNLLASVVLCKSVTSQTIQASRKSTSSLKPATSACISCAVQIHHIPDDSSIQEIYKQSEACNERLQIEFPQCRCYMGCQTSHPSFCPWGWSTQLW